MYPNSQKATVPGSLLNKVGGLRYATLIKKGLWHSYFPVNFLKLIRTPLYRTPPLVASVVLLASVCYSS